MIDAAIPKIRRDHLLADIEVGMHPLRQASGINQQGAALGRDQQNGIALPDVDGRHLHHAGAKVRARGDKRNPAPQRRTATLRKRKQPSARAAPPASRASSAAIEARIIASEGMATRRSAIDSADVHPMTFIPTPWAPPSQCTVPAIPSSARPEIQTAGLASASRCIPGRRRRRRPASAPG